MPNLIRFQWKKRNRRKEFVNYNILKRDKTFIYAIAVPATLRLTSKIKKSDKPIVSHIKKFGKSNRKVNSDNIVSIVKIA